MLHTLPRSAWTVTVFTTVWLCLAFLSIDEASATKVYRWIDENGVVTYGDNTHRPETAPSEAMQLNAPKSATKTDKKTDASETSKDGEKPADKSAEKPAPVAEQPKIPAAEKRKLCTQARNDLTIAQSRGQLREVDAKGQVTTMTDEQKQSRIKVIKQDIREYCR